MRRTTAQIQAAEHMVAGGATIVVPMIAVSGVASHPEDDLVIAAAVSAGVDYLVTGDKPLQQIDPYQGVTIVSPCAFLDLLETTGGNES